jgi:predicted metalloprotease
MRWDDFRRSDNVEDARDGGGGFAGGGGMGGGGIGLPTGGLGIGTIVVLALLAWAFGIDPRLLIGGAEILQGGGTQARYEQPTQPRESRNSPPHDQTGDFIAAVLGNTEDTWGQIFSEAGQTYERPKLRLFSGAERTPCVYAQAAMGPFYCPIDQRVYLDTSFFRDLQRKFGACDNDKACQFSEAYVVAHEVGHHVQNLLGILPKVQQAQQRAGDRATANQLQVRVELQADCLAGVWANRSNRKQQFIESGDVEQALQTAAAIGDDRLQRQSRGYVVPDSFTHGTSEQRKRWFMIGLKEGSVQACNTFNAAQL